MHFLTFIVDLRACMEKSGDKAAAKAAVAWRTSSDRLVKALSEARSSVDALARPGASKEERERAFDSTYIAMRAMGAEVGAWNRTMAGDAAMSAETLEKRM